MQMKRDLTIMSHELACRARLSTRGSASSILGLGLGLGLVMVAFGACSPAVPDTPTWSDDVRPILMANCVRCHTDPGIEGAPPGFRFDVCDDWVAEDGANVLGAAAMAPRIAARAADSERPMPPVIGPLEGRQQDVLQRWLDQGADCGQPDPANQAPSITITPGPQDALAVPIPYAITDADGDVVIGILRADDIVITARLHSGLTEVVWDVSGLPAGTYQITAELDDGRQRVDVALGSIDVVVPLQ